MHPAVENFLQRPLSHKVGFWIGSLVLVVGGFWQFSFSSNFKQIEAISEEVLKLDSSIVTERRLAANLDKARDKLKDLESKLSDAVAQLPDKSEIDDLLERISNLARESGLELNLFKRNAVAA